MNGVLITGGAKRMGAAIARAVAEAGFRPVIHANSSADAAAALARELGGQVVLGDLADPRTAERLIREAAAETPLFGLINNASRFEFDQAGSVTAEHIALHIAPNLTGPVLLTRHFAAALDLPNGVVINLLDQKLANLNPDFFSYTLSKAALAAATEMFAMALAPRIRVCGIAPGISLPAPKQSREKFEKAWRANPLQRGSLPEDIARAAVFILRTPSITGTTVYVDGGEHLMRRSRDVGML